MNVNSPEYRALVSGLLGKSVHFEDIPQNTLTVKKKESKATKKSIYPPTLSCSSSINLGFSQNKDVDRLILQKLTDEDLFNTLLVNKYANSLASEDFWRNRAMSKGIDIYKKTDENWKQFYLRSVYYIAKMKEKYNFEYTGGDFKKQYYHLRNYPGKDDLLYYMAKNGELSLVKHAIKNGAKIHSREDGALRVASTYGHLNVVKYLLDHKADIHAYEDEPLRKASENGDLELVKYLVDHGASIWPSRAFLSAASKGHLDIVKYLHSQGIHNIQPANIQQALEVATKNNYNDIVEYIRDFML